jgi:hypothetical protein
MWAQLICLFAYILPSMFDFIRFEWSLFLKVITSRSSYYKINYEKLIISRSSGFWARLWKGIKLGSPKKQTYFTNSETAVKKLCNTELDFLNNFVVIPISRATPTLKQPLRGRRRPLRTPKFVNTSMEIWEIQKQLKRGEMVQVRTWIRTHANWFHSIPEWIDQFPGFIFILLRFLRCAKVIWQFLATRI